ncbi:MAG TPA: hypothetical protein VLG15_08820 [Thermoanaerobaculia bacterium]|nr:hypothetical protein [Thermoanaerobaculia bacterium]
MKTRSLPRRSLLFALGLFSIASILPARIISYAPVTDRHAMPAVQHRTNRNYLLIEADYPISIYSGAYSAKLVLYDSKGEREPRVLFGGPGVTISEAATREEIDGTLRILVRTNAAPGSAVPGADRFLYSSDSGATWRVLAVGGPTLVTAFAADVGGPVARGRGAAIRIGTTEFPFVFVSIDHTIAIGRVHAVRADGGIKVLRDLAVTYPGPGLLGSNREGTKFLLSGSPVSQFGPLASSVRVLDLDGNLEDLQPLPQARYGLEGWITPDGSVYLEDSGRVLWLYRGGTVVEVARAFPESVGPPVGPGVPPPVSQTMFSIPTSDFSGAWIIQRGVGLPTILSRHSPGSAVVEQWRDVTAPEVEALHAAASGSKLLVQVHVPRPQADQRIFRDPALAVWEVGKPAPTRYDELFLVEGPFKGFVHLDVDAIGAGDTFVFDSAATFGFGGGATPSPSPGGGGGDVVQEWGVVRASLKQKLVVPAVGRLPGAFDTFWRTDLIVRNPSSERISVLARFVPSASGESFVDQPVERRIELGPSEIWLYADVLGSIFDIPRGSGALFLIPDGDFAITATSRTYTDSPRGTYGMGIGAVDLFAAAGARFSLSFSGALQGSDFRTNFVAVDTSGRGSDVSVRVLEPGDAQVPPFAFRAPAGGQTQLNGLGEALGVPLDRTGGLLVQPLSGEVVASVVSIDNRTNDPTYFPPDLPSPYVRTIPAIGHVDGANGSRFRSDLFLFNPSERSQSVTLTAKRWDVGENEAMVTLSLAAGESRVVRDVFQTLFGKTGIGRLRYVSTGLDTGVRVTSRLYTVEEDGGTFGLLMPPLNSFQSAGPGESLEILGPQGGRNFRTNLSLVELTAFANGSSAPVQVEIYDDFGALLDRFEASVPIAGGIQLLDIFRARGLGNGPPAALIRISPRAGLVGAFATTLDNGTNDPTYHGASLGSR